MKNNRGDEPLTVRVALYFAAGQEYELEPIFLGPRQTHALVLNQVIEGLPPAFRGGKPEGTVGIHFRGENASALMGSVSVTNPERGIAWNFRLYPRVSQLPSLPLQGLFWFYDTQSDGFVAMQNTSYGTIEVTPRFHLAGQQYALGPIAIAPERGYKLEIRKALDEVGMPEATVGGIELRYTGPGDALRAHGVVFNKQGFSAELDFHQRDIREEAQVMTRRTPRFALGPADPRLGLPSPITFDSYLVLHNFATEPVGLQLFAAFRGPEGSQERSAALQLGGGESRVVDIRDLLQGEVPDGVSWGSLEATYQGQQNVLAAELISVSQNGKHTMRSVMNWVQGSASEGWHWRADADYNTLIGIYNADSEEARVLVSLDYAANGEQHSYELPEIVIPPRVSELVDVAQALASGQVDADAELTGVTTGGYRVQKVGPRIDKPLLTETLVVNRRTKNFETFYNTCCNLTSVHFLPSSLLGPVGGSGQLEISAYDGCSGQFINFTSSGSYSSFNSSIASVGSSTGSASYVNPGDTTLRSVLNFFRPANCFTRSCDPSGPCEPASAQGDTPANPWTASLSCGAAATRGQSGGCSVTVTNPPQGATITYSEWKFTSGNITIIRDGSNNFSSWSGTVVENGTVSVKVAVSGSTQSKTLSRSITVEPRNWHTNPASPAGVPNKTFCNLPLPPQPNVVACSPSGLGSSNVETGDPGFSSTIITSGPNSGYAYFATLPISTFFQYEINPDLEISSSTFSTHQCGDFNANTNPGGFISRSNLFTQTKRHEFNSATQSHHAFYSNSINSSTNNPGDFFERQVAPPGTDLQAWVNDVRAGLDTRYNQIKIDSGTDPLNPREPFAVNESETGSFLGNINYAPYTPCP